MWYGYSFVNARSRHRFNTKLIQQEQHGGAASSSGRVGEGDDDEQPDTPCPESTEAILKKREYVLKELVETEEIYVSDLRLICEGYMRHMQVIHHQILKFMVRLKLVFVVSDAFLNEVGHGDLFGLLDLVLAHMRPNVADKDNLGSELP